MRRLPATPELLICENLIRRLEFHEMIEWCGRSIIFRLAKHNSALVYVYDVLFTHQSGELSDTVK